MSKQANQTKGLVQTALMAALVVVVSFVPFLGFVPLGVIKATTVHIPVILGAILLGPKAGGLLGGVFGVCSILKNTMEPALVSFVFSPLIPVPGTDSGSWKALVVSLVPRILVGVLAGLTYQGLAKVDSRGYLACGAAAAVGSAVNTIFVMGLIYLLFGPAYAAAQSIPFEALLGVILTVIGTQGLAEMAVAIVLAVLVGRPLAKYLRR